MKQTLAVALALALAAAALMAVERLGYEQRNNTVEIVADLQGFMQFVQADFPLEEILAELSRLGIESVGLREWALAEKMAFGYAQPDLLLDKQEDWPQLLAEPAGLNPWEVDMVAAPGCGLSGAKPAFAPYCRGEAPSPGTSFGHSHR